MPTPSLQRLPRRAKGERSRTVALRLTADEYAAAETAARNSGVSVARWFVESGLDRAKKTFKKTAG